MRGFTVIELLVVVAILAIMIGISIFSLPTAQRSLNVDFAVAQLVDVLRFANQRALAERQVMRVEITPSTNAAPGTIQVVDQNTLTNGVGDDAVIRTETLPLPSDATIDVGTSGLPIPPSPFDFLAATLNPQGKLVFYFTPDGAGSPDLGLTRAVTLFGPTSAVRTWRYNPPTMMFEEM